MYRKCVNKPATQKLVTLTAIILEHNIDISDIEIKDSKNGVDKYERD